MQTWQERVDMLSVHPDAATRDDVAQMAAEIQEYWLLFIDQSVKLERQRERELPKGVRQWEYP